MAALGFTLAFAVLGLLALICGLALMGRRQGDALLTLATFLLGAFFGACTVRVFLP